MFEYGWAAPPGCAGADWSARSPSETQSRGSCPGPGSKLYSTWIASTDGFTDSISNQPWKFTVVVASGCALNDGDVSAPK